MSDDQMRQAFELFYALNFDECDVFMQKQWEAAWKASRAALVVELPAMPRAQRTDEEATYSAGGGDMLRRCVKAIEAAGVTVKP